jgi:hypothetical protein
VKLDWDAIGLNSLDGPIQLRNPSAIRSSIVESDPRGEVEVIVYHAGQEKVHQRSRNGLPSGTLRELCVRPQRGFFTVVSQVSPTGGGDFEDSALLDPTDPDSWLLAVIVRDGQNFTVYRRLYHR